MSIAKLISRVLPVSFLFPGTTEGHTAPTVTPIHVHLGSRSHLSMPLLPLLILPQSQKILGIDRPFRAGHDRFIAFSALRHHDAAARARDPPVYSIRRRGPGTVACPHFLIAFSTRAPPPPHHPRQATGPSNGPCRTRSTCSTSRRHPLLRGSNSRADAFPTPRTRPATPS